MAREGAEGDASSRAGDQKLPEFLLLASDSQPVASPVKKHLAHGSQIRYAYNSSTQGLRQESQSLGPA